MRTFARLNPLILYVSRQIVAALGIANSMKTNSETRTQVLRKIAGQSQATMVRILHSNIMIPATVYVWLRNKLTKIHSTLQKSRQKRCKAPIRFQGEQHRLLTRNDNYQRLGSASKGDKEQTHYQITLSSEVQESRSRCS